MTIYYVTNCCQLRFFGTSKELCTDEHCEECGAKWIGATLYKIGTATRPEKS